MREGTPMPRREKRKEKERELVARLTPEICYIDLAFPLTGAEIVISFLGNRKRERILTSVSSRIEMKEKEAFCHLSMSTLLTIRGFF